jgi:hypothetical protein
METSLEPAGTTAAAAPTAAGGADPATAYLARLTSAESRRAMATSLELLAELLVDGRSSSPVACDGPKRSPSTSTTTTPPPAGSP